jgi:hypothetical protein
VIVIAFVIVIVGEVEVHAIELYLLHDWYDWYLLQHAPPSFLPSSST